MAPSAAPLPPFLPEQMHPQGPVWALFSPLMRPSCLGFNYHLWGKLLAHLLYQPPTTQGTLPWKPPHHINPRRYKPCLMTSLTSPPPEVPASTAPACFDLSDSNLMSALAQPSPSHVPVPSPILTYLPMLSARSFHPPCLTLQP